VREEFIWTWTINDTGITDNTFYNSPHWIGSDSDQVYGIFQFKHYGLRSVPNKQIIFTSITYTATAFLSYPDEACTLTPTFDGVAQTDWAVNTAFGTPSCDYTGTTAELDTTGEYCSYVTHRSVFPPSDAYAFWFIKVFASGSLCTTMQNIQISLRGYYL